MKAIVCPTYGSPDVLEFRDVGKPNPKDDEVLVNAFMLDARFLCSSSPWKTGVSGERNRAAKEP